MHTYIHTYGREYLYIDRYVYIYIYIYIYKYIYRYSRPHMNIYRYRFRAAVVLVLTRSTSGLLLGKDPDHGRPFEGYPEDSFWRNK